MVVLGVSWENSVGKEVNLGECMGLCGRIGHFFGSFRWWMVRSGLRASLWPCVAGDGVTGAALGADLGRFRQFGRVCDWYRSLAVCFVPQKLNTVVKKGTFGIKSQNVFFGVEQKQ